MEFGKLALTSHATRPGHRSKSPVHYCDFVARMELCCLIHSARARPLEALSPLVGFGNLCNQLVRLLFILHVSNLGHYDFAEDSPLRNAAQTLLVWTRGQTSTRRDSSLPIWD